MKKVEISPYLFRSLDIRGADPDYVKAQNFEPGSPKAKSAHGSALNADIAYVIGQAIVETLKPEKVVVGYDARLTSPELSKALIGGINARGVDVDLIGLVTTDKLYFAIGHYKYDVGVMVTGSHTIKNLNGFKISKYKNGRVMPVAKGTGMEMLKEVALKQDFSEINKKGAYKQIDISNDFNQYYLSFFDYKNFKRQKVVFDAGNGSAGVTFEKIIDQLPIDAIKLNFKPDGNFPAHEPDPMIPENMEELIDTMGKESADFGISWDGDSDRIALISKKYGILAGGFTTAVLLNWIFEKHPHAKIIYTTPMSWAVRKICQKHNGEAIYAKVGNSFVKNAIEEYDASFAGEEADHFMFAESFYAESGILPLLVYLDLVTKKNISLDEIISESVGLYKTTGDINVEAKHPDKVLESIEKYYAELGASINTLDGVLVEMPSFHFALRPSSNDPVVRLNLEAESVEERDKRSKEVVHLIERFDK